MNTVSVPVPVPQVSSLYQVLVSIQSIILIPEPLYNEPGYEGMRGTAEGDRRSRETNSELALYTIRHAMCDAIRQPPEGFQEVVQVYSYFDTSLLTDQSPLRSTSRC